MPLHLCWKKTLRGQDPGEPGKSLNGLAWSPDGSRLAVSCVVVDEDVINEPGGASFFVFMYDRDGAPQRNLHGHNSIAWSPSGDRLLTTIQPEDDGLTGIYTLSALQEQGFFQYDPRVLTQLPYRSNLLAWPEENTLFLTSPEDTDTCVKVTDLSGAHPLPFSPLLPHRALDLAPSPDGRHLATFSSDGALALWSTQTREQTALTVPLPCARPRRRWSGIPQHGTVQWSRDGSQLMVSGSWSPDLLFLDASSGEPLRALRSGDQPILLARWSTNRRHIAVARGDTLSVLDAQTGDTVDSYTIQDSDGLHWTNYSTTLMRWSPSGDSIAVGFQRFPAKYTSRLWVLGFTP